MSLLDKIFKNCEHPSWLPDNLIYATLMGSQAYGTNNENSDVDIYGVVIPPVKYIFPQTEGYVHSFDKMPVFEQWQGSTEINGVKHEITVYSLPRFFRLALDNNPNILEMMFTARECVLRSSAASESIRQNRKKFLHKKCINTFKAYAYSQLSNVTKAKENSKRKELIDKFGYDTKAMSHVVRLILQYEQLIKDSDMDLRLHREYIKRVKYGQEPLNTVKEWFDNKVKLLEELEGKSELPDNPRTDEVRELLLKLIKYHYPSLDKNIPIDQKSESEKKIQKIRKILDEPC